MSRRSKKSWLLLLSLAIIVFFFLAGYYGWFNKLEQGVVTQQPGLYSIDHYVDGDTIAVNMNGTVEEIRFIGIDTPETHKPNTPVQCFGPAASAHTQALIKATGGKVRLASDSLSTNRDRYDRLLRYVYLTDGRNLNEVNVRDGYAFYYPYFPFSKSDQFKTDEQAAIKAKKGLWAACQPTPSDGGGYKMDETQAEADAARNGQ
jgi:micrococcal nuclease